MDPAQIRDLTHRMAFLEVAVVVLAVLLIGLVLLHFIVLASRTQVVLRNRRGKGSIVVGLSEADDPEIVLWGRDQASRLTLGFDSEGYPYLDMGGRPGLGRFTLQMSEGGPVAALVDGEGEQKFTVGFDKNRDPGMTIWDRSGKARIDLSSSGPSGPYLAVFDDQLTHRLILGISPSGELALVFFGEG